MNRALLSVLALSLVAAQCDVKPSPITPEPIPTPAPPPPEAPGCESACRRLAAMGCPDAEPTDAGATCEAVCENVQASGTIRYPVACVSSARSCAAAEVCFQ